MPSSPVDSNHLFPEVEDPEVTDAQLGAIVRAYRGVSRPPQVIIVKPSWFEVMTVIVCMALAGTVAVGVAVLYHASITNRNLGAEIIDVVCITHVDLVDPDLNDQVRKICTKAR